MRTKWRKVCLEAMPEIGRGCVLTPGAEGRSGPQELDGRLGHDEANDIWRDMRRDNRSEVKQVRHLRYGWADMVHRPCQVAIEQGLVLRQQGWRCRFKRCPDCPSVLPAELKLPRSRPA